MPKRSFWREMVLITLPLLFIGGVFGWNEWQKRFRTPTIALSVQFGTPKISPMGQFDPDWREQLYFGWKAVLRGGPKQGYHFGWNERLVAQTRRGPVTVWQLNTPPKSWSLDAASGTFGLVNTRAEFSSYQGLNRGNQWRHYTLEGGYIPVDTQSLAWHGEMVAIPADNADPWQSPLSHTTLQSWAQMPGAALCQKTVALPYNTQDFGPVVVQLQKPIGGSDKNQTRVRVLSRWENRRTFWRVVAIVSHQQRILWSHADGVSGICQSISHEASMGTWNELLSFDIKNIPAAQGEIIFLSDTVFDINKRAPTVSIQDVGLSERGLAAFERQTGGYRVSRRLILRPASTLKPKN